MWQLHLQTPADRGARDNTGDVRVAAVCVCARHGKLKQAGHADHMMIRSAVVHRQDQREEGQQDREQDTKTKDFTLPDNDKGAINIIYYGLRKLIKWLILELKQLL